MSIFLKSTIFVFGLTAVNFVHAQTQIEGKLVTETGARQSFLFEPGKPFLMDSSSIELFKPFIGCEGRDMSQHRDRFTKGFKLEILSSSVIDNGAIISIAYSEIVFNNLVPLKINDGCVLNKLKTTAVETVQSTYLKKDAAQTIVFGEDNGIGRITFTLK